MVISWSCKFPSSSKVTTADGLVSPVAPPVRWSAIQGRPLPIANSNNKGAFMRGAGLSVMSLISIFGMPPFVQGIGIRKVLYKTNFFETPGPELVHAVLDARRSGAARGNAQPPPNGEVRVRVKVCDDPLRVATTDVVTASETAFAVTVKLALVPPAATNTDAGIVSAVVAVPSFNATVTPPVGAAADNAIVQVDEPGVTTFVSEQESVFTKTGGNRLKENVAEAPLRLAVRTAEAGAFTGPV